MIHKPNMINIRQIIPIALTLPQSWDKHQACMFLNDVFIKKKLIFEAANNKKLDIPHSIPIISGRIHFHAVFKH
jgi:hypothetical protein